MFKGKFVVLSLIAAALLCWQVMPASVQYANSGQVDPCSSTATSAGGCWFICPLGDGSTLAAIGATISVNLKDGTGAAIAGVPAADFWVIGWGDSLCLCGGSGAINADAASDGSGDATISGTLAGGGCDTGIQVVVQGVVLADPTDWTQPLCLDIETKSADITCDLVVESADFSLFSQYFTGSLAYSHCADYNCDGDIESIDFSLFAQHFNHSCNP
jgi:hypothetical protein